MELCEQKSKSISPIKKISNRKLSHDTKPINYNHALVPKLKPVKPLKDDASPLFLCSNDSPLRSVKENLREVEEGINHNALFFELDGELDENGNNELNFENYDSVDPDMIIQESPVIIKRERINQKRLSVQPSYNILKRAYDSAGGTPNTLFLTLLEKKNKQIQDKHI